MKRTFVGFTFAAAAGVALLVGRAWGRAEKIAASSEKVFELRTYTANEGKLDELHKRFRDHTCKLFTKHGIENVGYWTPTSPETSKTTLIYIVAHASKAAADKSWQAFKDDPEWQAAYKKSHENGVLVKKVESVYLKATDYSPIK